jgi:hypothetical protein
MKTTINNPEYLYQYLSKTGADFVVDKNPSEEKISRIREAIQRKKDLFDMAIERFKNSSNIQVLNNDKS